MNTTVVAAPPALSLSVEFGPSAPENQREIVLSTVNMALNLIANYPVTENNLFSWNADRKILSGKKFVLLVTNTDDPILQKMSATAPGGVGTADAATVKAVSLAPEEMLIITFLLADRVFYSPSGLERADGFVRTVVAFAHEIYGTVQQALEDEISKLSEQTLTSLATDQVGAFTASIKFLEKLIGSPTFGKLPAKTRNEFLDAKVRELNDLKHWQGVLRDTTTANCPTALAGSVVRSGRPKPRASN